MAIPVSGRVTLQDNQAVVVLSVDTQPQPPHGQDPQGLQALLEQVVNGQVPVHQSRQPVLKKHFAAMVCNIQRGLKLQPVGLFGAWNPQATNKLLHALTTPKLVRAAKKPMQPLALPAPASW